MNFEITIQSSAEVVKALSECFVLENLKGYQILGKQILISENADFFIYSHPMFWAVSRVWFPDEEITVEASNYSFWEKKMTFRHGELIRAEMEICTYQDCCSLTKDNLEKGNFTFPGFKYPI